MSEKDEKYPSNRVTAKEIIEHLREYGPNARVLLLIGGENPEKTVKDSETGPIYGKLGIMSLYGDEVSSVRPDLQMTHKGGGIIRVKTASHAANSSFTAGIAHTLVWAEDLGHLGLDGLARSRGRTSLKLKPSRWIESKEGLIVNDSDPVTKG